MIIEHTHQGIYVLRRYKERNSWHILEPVLKIIVMAGVGVAAVALLLVAFSGGLFGQDTVGEDATGEGDTVGKEKDDGEIVTNDITGELAQTSGRDAARPPEVVMPTKSSRPGCEIESLCYIPESLSVDVGSKVVWINQDAAFHSVTSGEYGEADGMFDSGHMDPEERFEYVFNDTGRFLYHCTLHPWMTGVVEVKER